MRPGITFTESRALMMAECFGPGRMDSSVQVRRLATVWLSWAYRRLSEA